MKLNKILYVFAVLCVATASASLWFFITTYHSKVRPPIDSIFFEWGDYGALLAGVCTLAAALFSLATLLYLISFNRDVQKENRDFIIEQRALISRQMELSELEKYTRHKDLFNERLDHIEKRFGHKFKFLEPFQLYRAAFPNNRIGQTNIRHKIGAHSDTPTYLEYAVNRYQVLTDKVKGYPTLPTREVIDLFSSLRSLHSRLQIQYDQQAIVPGDIIFFGTRTGFNCFRMSEAVREVTYVLNELLEFTGNKLITSFEDHADVLRSGLLDYFTAPDADINFCIHDPHGAIAALYSIHNHSEKLQSDPAYSEIYMMWFSLINSNEKIAELANTGACRKLGEYIQHKAIGFNYSNDVERTHYYKVMDNAGHLARLG